MKPLLIAGALTIALTGCSFVGALPAVDRLSNLISGQSAPKLTPIEAATQTSPGQPLGAERGEGALSVVAGQAGWIVDPVSNCATTNPFARADEEIRWFGACGGGGGNSASDTSRCWMRSRCAMPASESRPSTIPFSGAD